MNPKLNISKIKKPVGKQTCLTTFYLLGLFAALFAANPAHATTVVWTNTVMVYTSITSGGSISANWNSAINWSPNQVPGPGDDVYFINGYTATLEGNASVASLTLGSTAGTNIVSGGAVYVTSSGNLTVGNLNLRGGTLENTGPVTVNGLFNWVGGTIISDGGVTLNGTSSLNGIGTATLYLNGLLRNAGQLTWGGSGANLYCQGSGLLTNLPTGTLTIAADVSTANSSYGTIANAGLMRKTGGTGTSTLTAPFINNGDVQVQSGTLAFTGGGPAATGQFEVSANTTLQFASGGFTFNPPASLTGAGTLLVSGGTVNWSGIGSLAGTNFITSSGTLNVMTPGSLAVTNLIVNGALGGSGPVTVNGPFVWNSGTIISDGGVTLNGTGSLNGIGTATLYLNGLLRNAGQLTWGGSGANLYCQGSGLLTNLPTGTLNKARFFHTATLLPSGKVLVAGGYGTNNDILFSAELYDPASGIWTATGAMNTNRAAHTATLLPNGSVLVAGGFPNGGYLSSAELYDPVNPSGYNQMTSQLLSGSKIRLSFTGDSGANYALDHTFNLAPVNWVPQATNPAGAGGVLQFTNTPNAATNNFWRIRSVP